MPSAAGRSFELIVDTVDSQIRDTMRVEPAPYRAFISALVRLHLRRQLVRAIPGVEPPTAHLETDAALALIVFLAMIWFGIRARGVGGFHGTFARPARS